MGLGKLVQMVPIHLGFLRSRVGRAQAKVQIPNETFTWIMMFINSESCLAEKTIPEHKGTSIHILLQGSLKIVAGKTGFPVQTKNLSLVSL